MTSVHTVILWVIEKLGKKDEFIFQVLKQLGIFLVKLASPQDILNVFCESLTFLKQNITDNTAIKK